jgi:hypothetical protein
VLAGRRMPVEGADSILREAEARYIRLGHNIELERSRRKQQAVWECRRTTF